MRIHLAVLTLVVLWSQSVFGQVRMQIKAFDREDFRGTCALAAGNAELARLSYTGVEKYLSLPVVTLPPGANELKLSGTFDWTHGTRGTVKSAGEQVLPVVDLNPLLAPLRSESWTWDRRLAAFLNAQKAFEDRYPDVASELSFVLEAGEKATPADLAKAEQRLGYPLPAEYRQMLTGFGAWTIDDSFVTAPKDLQNAFEQMVHLWGTPRSALNALSRETRELLKTSVILYTEAGDGYGALIYQPPQLSTGRKEPAYYWLHQDTEDDPRRLNNRDGSPKTGPQAWLWLYGNKALQLYADGSPNAVFVDSSSPIPQHYELFPRLEKEFGFTLSLVWTEFE